MSIKKPKKICGSCSSKHSAERCFDCPDNPHKFVGRAGKETAPNPPFMVVLTCYEMHETNINGIMGGHI